MNPRVAVPVIGDSTERIEQTLSRLGAQSLPREALQVVIVDRTDGHVGAAVAGPFLDRFDIRILPQGPSKLAAGGNLAVFGATAPVLVFLDPLLQPDADLLAAHLAAQDRMESDAVAVIGTATADAAIDRAVLSDRPRLLSFGWRQPKTLGRGRVWGGSVSVRRSALIRFGLFEPHGRPGFDDVEPAWRLAERPFSLAFEPSAGGRLGGNEDVDDYTRRAFLLGLQEDVHRGQGRRSFFEPVGRPSDWWDRRQMKRRGAAALYAAAREADAERPGSRAARSALRAALYAAWRTGRTEAIGRLDASAG